MIFTIETRRKGRAVTKAVASLAANNSYMAVAISWIRTRVPSRSRREHYEMKRKGMICPYSKARPCPALGKAATVTTVFAAVKLI